MAFLVDRDQRRLANTLEVLTVHVDLGSRRPTPMPTEIASGFDRHIAMGDELGWAAPTCGAIAVRRPVPHLGWLRHSIGSASC
jgi:acyl-CoA thioester hydrolase